MLHFILILLLDTICVLQKIIHLEGNLSEAINMKKIVANEVDALKNNVFEFKKLQEAFTNSKNKRNVLFILLKIC